MITSQKLSDKDSFDTFGYLQLAASTTFLLPKGFNLTMSCFYNSKMKIGNITVFPILNLNPTLQKQFGKHWSVSSSPQSTLIISELKNKYPKKYPKRLFRVLFLSLLTSCANVGGSKRTAPRKRPLMLRSSPSPKSRGSAFLFPRSWFCPWSWCRRLRRLCFGCRLWRTFGLRLSFRIRAVSRR